MPARENSVCRVSSLCSPCFCVCASIDKSNERWASYWLRGQPLHGRVLGAAASPKVLANCKDPSFILHRLTVHTTSTLAPRGPSTAALESQHLASAVRPLLQHFQSSTPAHWAAGEFALDPGFGWGILRGEGVGESEVRKRAASAVLTAHCSQRPLVPSRYRINALNRELR